MYKTNQSRGKYNGISREAGYYFYHAHNYINPMRLVTASPKRINPGSKMVKKMNVPQVLKGCVFS